MKKNKGFTSFEFYFVMSVIGIIVLVGLQRYFQLAEETQRFSFQIVAQHFNTSVYNFHTQWIVAQQTTTEQKVIDFGGKTEIESNRAGWPLRLAKPQQIDTPEKISVEDCYELWMALLQNPPSISRSGGDAYGSRAYHLSLTSDNSCRYEFITSKPSEYFFDYIPDSGQVILHTPAKK